MFLKNECCVVKEEESQDRIVSKVAVVVATHNRPWMLEGALINILSQSFCNLSILIVDNGNLPETETIARTYMRLDPRITYIKNVMRKGAAATRNHGLFSLSREIKHVLFLDDDDRFSEQDSLKSLVESHLADSRRLMTYGIQRDVNTDGSLYQIWPCRKECLTDMIIDDNKVQFPAHTVLWNAVFARCLGGYSFQFENDMEDIAFIVRGFANLRSDPDSIAYVDSPIVNWRRGNIEEDTLHSKVRRNEKSRILVRRRIKRIILHYSGYRS